MMQSFYQALLASGGYDPDYQTLLTHAQGAGYTIPPDSTKKTLENATMIGIKDVFGVSSIADAPIVVMQMFKTTGDSDYATLCWKTLNVFQATKVSTPIHTSDLGFNSDGAASYLNSEVSFFDFDNDDFTIASHSFVDISGNNFALGASDGADLSETIALNPRNSSNQTTYRAFNNSTGGPVTSTVTATDRITFGRLAGNIHYAKNGAAFTTTSNTYDAPENDRDIFLLAHNNGGGGAINFSIRGKSYFILFNRKLTDAENADLDAVLQNYLS